MATKKINPRTARKKADLELMAMRMDKVNKLAAAKEAHDMAVQHAQEDELRDYGKQLDLFMKRAPELIQMATQVSKLTTLPMVKMRKFGMDKEEYVFKASTYVSNNLTPLMCIGATRQREGFGCAYYIVIGPDGQWVTNKAAYEPSVRLVSFETLVDNIGEKRWYPNAKDFMVAALEWEKQLYSLVDSL